MRRFALGMCLLVMATLFGVDAAYAQPAGQVTSKSLPESGDPTVVAELRKLDEQRLKAISDADMTAVAALLADDYIHSHAVGTIQNKTDYVANLGRNPRKSYRAPDAKVATRVYGDIAVMVGPQFNKRGEGQPSHYAVTLVWRKIGGSWKQVSAAYSPIPAPKM